jgi:hypothetical protein
MRRKNMDGLAPLWKERVPEMTACYSDAKAAAYSSITALVKIDNGQRNFGGTLKKKT